MMCRKSNGILSRFSQAQRSRCCWATCWCIALALFLLLPSWSSYGQASPTTSRLGPNDYQEYQASLLVLEAKMQFYKNSLKQAAGENLIIRDELRRALEQLAKLRSEQAQHSDGSTQFYEELQQTIRRLTERLRASDGLVAELRRSLESAKQEYHDRLIDLEARARKLERENRLLKWGCRLLGIGAAVGGLYFAGDRFGWW